MYCLLCHEKIPRLRAWRTKSEFCSDEHAAQYKKQTLDRLLTDQNPARKEKPDPIALTDEPDEDLTHDEMSLGMKRADPAAIDDAFGGSDIDDSSDGVEELWRMAEEIEHTGSDRDFLDKRFGEPEVARQSAEEALRALRMLAEKATESKSFHDDGPLERSDLSFLSETDSLADEVPRLGDIDDLPPISDELMAELGDDLPDFDEVSPDAEITARRETEEPSGRKPADGPVAEDFTAASGAAGEGLHAADDDAPSILERLMEDPSANWAQRRQDSSPPPPSARGRTRRDPADELDDDPLADFGDLPEPEFAFDDDLLEGLERIEPPAAAHAVSEGSGDDEWDANDDPLADLAALADDLEGEPDLDPLAALIRAEEAAQSRGEDDDSDDAAFDEAVADELVKELTEQTLRDELDLQQLERSLKVVPFPAPDDAGLRNGRHKHAGRIVDDADAALEAHPLLAAEPAEKAASAKPPARPERPSRTGRNRTKFKPSMVMAGVELSIQGYLQGDPLETWRVTAVESAWGESGLPRILSFEVQQQTVLAPSELRVLRPERDFRGRMGLPIAVCTPAEAPAVEAPLHSLEPNRSETALESPPALSLAESSSIRLGPEYRLFDDIAAIAMSHEGGGEEDSSDVTQLPAVQLPDALEPAAAFYDSVSIETRFVEEDDWEAPMEPSDPSQGIDLTADFADEQPTAHSSGGGRLYR